MVNIPSFVMEMTPAFCRTRIGRLQKVIKDLPCFLVPLLARLPRMFSFFLKDIYVLIFQLHTPWRVQRAYDRLWLRICITDSDHSYGNNHHLQHPTTMPVTWDNMSEARTSQHHSTSTSTPLDASKTYMTTKMMIVALTTVSQGLETRRSISSLGKCLYIFIKSFTILMKLLYI